MVYSVVFIATHIHGIALVLLYVDRYQLVLDHY